MSDLETERRELHRQVELFHAYEALRNNPNFRKLIEVGFCRDEVIHLNRNANREMTTEGKLAISQRAQAGPVLEDFLTRVRNDGEIAREKIPELDQLIAERADQNESED